jgi:hypothetical protein
MLSVAYGAKACYLQFETTVNIPKKYHYVINHLQTCFYLHCRVTHKNVGVYCIISSANKDYAAFVHSEQSTPTAHRTISVTSSAPGNYTFTHLIIFEYNRADRTE